MKKTLIGATTLFGAALGIALFLGSADGHAQGSSIQKGAEIAPVPLNLGGLNPALVRQGSYIVNAQGGCNDCHTVPSYAEGGDPFLGQPEVINADGYLAGGGVFGPFISRNLTPNASGRPAGLTLERFVEAMRLGTDFKNRHPEISPLLQVMPWPVYGKMSDRELHAIYEFLRAIPCLPDERNPNRCVS